jgi:hypothetical protein
VLQVVFSPHQEREMRDFLQGMQQTIAFTISEPPACGPIAAHHAPQDAQADPRTR